MFFLSVVYSLTSGSIQLCSLFIEFECMRKTC